ncbi:hypothetical protein AAFF_G00268390 [Aldrovandia affinis]|uniref:Uncharacterized protein n=1 Tax=Aldrovandia affinis TaxID=143900 RepID=A0AAD7SS51_9TELE|nr:hypothetical protein AAFF_G00268390 [Aldrovandia affinis]
MARQAQSADTLSLLVPSAVWSPDLSPVCPRSWAGSLECLLSPRPYRSQPNRSFHPAESCNRATPSPTLEQE